MGTAPSARLVNLKKKLFHDRFFCYFNKLSINEPNKLKANKSKKKRKREKQSQTFNIVAKKVA